MAVPDWAQDSAVPDWAREKPAPTRNIAAVANDWVIEAANAIAGTAGAVTEFVSPGNRFARGVEDFVRKGEESQSDVTKQSKQRMRQGLEQAEGFGQEAGVIGQYLLESPGLAAAQALGSFAGPGVAIGGASRLAGGIAAGRAAAGGATAAQAAARGAQVGSRVGLGAGAVVSGAAAGGDAAGNAYDLVMAAPDEVLSVTPEWQELAATLPPEQIKERLATAAARDGSVLPAIVGAVTGAFGAEKLIAGTPAAKIIGQATSRRAAALRTGLTEAAQEGFEEGITQYEGQRAASQYDPTIDPMQGVGAATTMGVALGGISGGIIGGVVGPERAAQAPAPAATSPDAQLDQVLNRVEQARNEVFLGTSDGKQTLTDIVSAPDLGAAIDAAEASVPSMADMLQQKRQAGAEAARLAMGEVLASATDQRTPEQIMADAEQRSQAAIAGVQAELGMGPAAAVGGRTAEQIVADFETKRAAAIAELQGSPTSGAVSPVDFEAKRKAAAERAIGEMGDSLPRFRYSPQMQGNKEQAPSTEPDLVGAYVQQMRETNTPAARAFVQLFDSGRITPADVSNTIARQNPENMAPAAPALPQMGTAVPAQGIQVERSGARPAPSLDLKNPESAVAERAAAGAAARDATPELTQQRLEAASAEGQRQAPMEPVQAGQYIAALRLENTPQARALVQEYEAGRVNDQDIADAVNAQRRYQLGGQDLTQARLETAAGQAPGPATNVQVERSGARAASPALTEAVQMYGSLPLTARDQTVEGASERLTRAAAQAPKTPESLLQVETQPGPRGAFLGRNTAIRQGNEALDQAAQQRGGERMSAPRPTLINGRAPASYTDQQLQALVQDQSIPAVSRRGAQTELAARQLEQRAAAPAAAAAAPGTVSPGGIILASEQRTDAAPEATQQGKPVSSLGNWKPVDPATLSTQSRTSDGTISRQTYRMVSLLASMFGKKVVVFDSDNDAAPDGFVRRGDSRTIYLNRKSEISHLVVFGHELLHQLKADNPQAYAALVKVIKLEAGVDTNVPGIRGDMEELTADIVGNRFREVEFWQDVFREILASGKDTKVSQRSAMKLGASVVRAVDRMVKALKGMTGFNTDEMVSNLQEVKSAVTKALASYAQEKRGEATELIRQEVAGQQAPAADTTGEVVASDKRGRLDNLEAYHYSQAPRKTLSSSMFGTGLRGSAREEYLNADDPRRRQRISFYFDKGTGVRPESGVGGVPHRATLDNIYDSNADPLGLRKGGQAAFETKVLDAGFDGYLDRMEGSQPGQIILLGKRDVPVQAMPPGPVRSGTRVEPLKTSAPAWTTQSSSGNKSMLEQKLARMQDNPSWASYDMQIVGTTPGMYELQTKLKADVVASEKRQVNTPEFKRWFGDSKVVDGRGRPLVVYHGTYTDFSKFRGGGYFSADPSYSSNTAEINAEAYDGAAQVMPVYLSLQNPAVRDVDFVEGIGYDGEAIAALEAQGYDGVMTPDKSEIYVFRPEQIKSAIGNSGAFDASNPDIRASEKRILLNIGLSTKEVKGGGLLTEDVVLSALAKLGLNVDSMPVHPSDTEPTAVPAIDRPLTQEEGDDLSARLNQEAIVQRMPDGSGMLFGPKADEWGPYNPAYFVMADGKYAIEYEIQASAKRRKTQEAGVEVPTTVDRAADSTAAFRRARGKVFDTNRELKTEIQDAVRAAAEDAGVDLSTFSAETEKYLVRIATAEAVKALRENANAIGWYREKVTKALRIAALKHPELNTDPESRMVFIWALAVTSNGMRVKKNFELADKAYSGWKRYKKFPTNIGQGTAKKAINNGLRAYNVLSKKMTFDQLHNAMLTKSPVAQIGKLLGIKPSGEYADTVVYGSAILGPKVGNGFFANLYGHYEQLTIDRWLMRTWGRWTGTLVEVKTDVVAKKADTLSALLDLLTAEQRTQLEQAIGRTVYLDDLEPTAAAISAATTKESVRDALDEVGPLDKDMRARLVEILGKEKANSKRVSLGDEIRKAGIGLYQAIDGQVEAPRDPQQRNDMRKVFDQVLTELQKNNPGLTMSDLQAVLWYPEKRIYDAAKTDKETDDGYEDGAAPDYANAAAEHYRGRGVAKSAIDRVIAQVDAELQAADGAGRGGRSAGGVAQQPGGVSDPSVAASEKREVASLFKDLQESRGLGRVRALERVDAHPLGATIRQIDADFLDILDRLDTAGLVKINCK